MSLIRLVPFFAVFACAAHDPAAMAEFNAASNLSVLRGSGDVCSTEAYQSDILDHLDHALALDPSLRSELSASAFDPVRHTVRFAALEGADLGTPEGVRAAVVGAPLYSQPVAGVYGSAVIVTLKPDGSVVVAELQDIDGAMQRVEMRGKWSMNGLGVQIDTPHAAWTLTVSADGTLRSASGVEFSDNPSECEA